MTQATAHELRVTRGLLGRELFARRVGEGFRSLTSGAGRATEHR